MAWAALTGPMPRRSVSPGTRSLTMACSWARLALSARAASRRASARRRISACRTACSRLASRGGRRRARPARRVSVSAPRARVRSVSSPPSSSARSRLVCAVLAVVSSCGRRAGSAAPRGPRRRAGWAAGRRPGAARPARPGARRSGRTCPSRGGPCGWAARTRSRSGRPRRRRGPARRRSCGCPRSTPPAAGPGAWSTIQASSSA